MPIGIVPLMQLKSVWQMPLAAISTSTSFSFNDPTLTFSSCEGSEVERVISAVVVAILSAMFDYSTDAQDMVHVISTAKHETKICPASPGEHQLISIVCHARVHSPRFSAGQFGNYKLMYAAHR